MPETLTSRLARARRAPVAAGVIAALLALTALVATGAGREPRPPFPRAQARAATLADPEVQAFLRGRAWSSVKVAPLDRLHWRVTIQQGPRPVLDASLGPDGRVADLSKHVPGAHPAGSTQVWALPVLLALTALFCSATAVLPALSMRNLDVAVLGLGATASLILDDQRLVRAEILVGSAMLAYVAGRAAWTAIKPARRPPTAPLWRHVTARLHSRERDRILRMVVLALMFLGVIVTVTSTGLADVGFAGLAGATALTHGLLPYGHITTEVVHGDTYPLLTYVLYLPFALISPVDDSFDGMDGALHLNAIALVLTAFLMYRCGRRLASGESGLLLAVAWLAFPPVVLAASAGGNDVPAAVGPVLALALWHRPVLSALALGVAGWVKVVPAVGLVGRLPQLRGRELALACAAVAAITGAVVVALLAIGGGHGPSQMVDALRFQVERGSYHSVWRQIGSPAAQRVFEALTIGFIVASGWLVATRPELRSDVRRVAALIAADVLLVQLGANYWSPPYLSWVMPFILVGLLLPPAVAAAAPPALPRSRLLVRRAP